MSLISDSIPIHTSTVQPSLVYPSLPRRKYHSLLPPPVAATEPVESNELQTCIQFASRLIRLRSELRSPAYMRSSPSIQAIYNNSHENCQSKPAPSTYSALSEVGRVQSLPNVSQYNEQENHHPYSKHLNFSEDESEIVSLNSSSTDEASQLTYLSALIRRGTKHAMHQLPLPPKHQLFSEQKKVSSTPSGYRTRSLSLRDRIHDVVDEAMNGKNSLQPIKRERYSSLALASQLLYASQQEEKEQEQDYKEKTEVVEEVVNQYEEKVEVPDILDRESKFIQAIKKPSPPVEDQCCTCNKKKTTAIPILADTPISSQSRDTNRSLFSTMSSDSEDEGSALGKLNIIKKRPTRTAFLVSLSPSSAAAATVAKSRRNHKRQVILRVHDRKYV